MLDPYERRVMLEALRPPEGFVLDHAVGTTYSLDLLALLAAPLAFSLFADADTPTTDPLVLLEALQATADRITLFCDAGRIYVPPADRLLFARLEGSVVEASAPRGGAFHPKVWLLRFTTAPDVVAYRFVCLSRNLTFDRCWDTAVVLDGQGRGRRRAANAPLAEFFKALPAMASREMDPARARAVLSLAEEVRRVEWHVPEPFEELVFHPLGHGKRRSTWPFEHRIDRMLVIAPFISGPMLDRLAQHGNGHVLVSRPDRLDQCNEERLQRYEEVLILEEEALPDDSDDTAMRGLHAKLFVADQGWDATVWSGSANATSAAFERNVEFLVELRGKKSRVGVDAFLAQGDASHVTLRSLLCPFVPSDALSAESESRRRLERDADELRRALAGGNLSVHVVPGETGELWTLHLERADQVARVGSLVALAAWPITRRAETGARPATLADEVIARFEHVPIEKITPFIAFRAELRDGDVEHVDEFVLNLPLHDAPADRHAQITRALLSSRSEVVRYLLYLLAGQGVEAVRALIEADPAAKSSADVANPLVVVPLVESLLRTLDRDPSRLTAVRRIVEDLSATEHGVDLLPEGWEAIWEPVAVLAKEVEHERATSS
ncbi:MAG: hypothetical protein V7607_5868 [Solirubrobacteraceae bacterium]